MSDLSQHSHGLEPEMDEQEYWQRLVEDWQAGDSETERRLGPRWWRNRNTRSWIERLKGFGRGDPPEGDPHNPMMGQNP
jgi:hypothetical protein